MPPLLRVQGDWGGGVHEAHSARWDALFLQGRLQPLRAWGLQGECHEASAVPRERGADAAQGLSFLGLWEDSLRLSLQSVANSI